MTDNDTASKSSNQLVRSIDWKQGLVIAMGIPILIVPSLCDLSVTLWSMSIIVWVLSVLSGFLLNMPLGELCATFGVAGIGGSIQHVYKDDERYAGKRVNRGRMIGSLGAWASEPDGPGSLPGPQTPNPWGYGPAPSRGVFPYIL